MCGNANHSYHIASCTDKHGHDQVPKNVIVYVMPIQKIIGWYGYVKKQWYGHYVHLTDEVEADYVEIVNLMIDQAKDTLEVLKNA